MKKLLSIRIYAVLALLLCSCADNDPLEFQVEKPESIALQEELNSYETLKTYLEGMPDFKLGAGVSISAYNSQGTLYNLINSNFREVTAGYGMKHGAIVQSDGSLSLGTLKDFYKKTQDAGLSIFGHTLVWHANQNAGYLNGLIAPNVFVIPSFKNELDLSGLDDGTFTNWETNGDISFLEDEGMVSGSNALKLTADNNSIDSTDLQLVSPEIPIAEDSEYEVIFYIKADGQGKGSVSFEGLEDNNPMLDYNANGETAETFAVGYSWKKISFKVKGALADSFKFKINLGYESGVTYYLDVDNMYVYDPNGEQVISNIVENGDFEAGTGWGGWGNGSTRGLTEDGGGYGNTGKAFFVNNPALANYWAAQSVYGFPEPLEMGASYKLKFWVKGDGAGTIRPELQSPDYSSNGFGVVDVTSDWKLVELETTVTAADRERLIFSFGEYEGTVYIDNVELSNTSSSGGGTLIVNKTETEKSQIIGAAMEDWISKMMETSSPYVHAWDVVNEPMDDGNPSELKTGVGRDLASDEFYWQDYLGKDYGVMAFKLAAEYGNDSDLLFINDYNLEYNLDKTKGLIGYVKYIEDNGGRVDGIGTQMHININTDKEKIKEMFQLLAETGKLIKVSELDVTLDSQEATPETLALQADMYKYVVDTYSEVVPPAQQYGITVWGITDSTNNSSWLPGAKQGLWNVNYIRKPAYAGFAEGLKNM